MHIKTGDTVKVIAGGSKGLVAKVLRIDRNSERAVLENGPVKKQHIKPEKNRKHPEGGIIEGSASIHCSNLMLMSETANRPFRSGVSVKNDKKNRVAKGRAASQESI